MALKLSFDVPFQRRQRDLPIARGDGIVAAPTRRRLVAVLAHVQIAAAGIGVTDDLQGHRTEGIAFGRHPPRVGDEELLSRPHVDDGAVKDTTERAEQLVAKRRRRPLDRVHAERHGCGDRSDGLPPRAQRLGGEKAFEDDGRRRGDEEALLESFAEFLRCGDHES